MAAVRARRDCVAGLGTGKWTAPRQQRLYTIPEDTIASNIFEARLDSTTIFNGTQWIVPFSLAIVEPVRRMRQEDPVRSFPSENLPPGPLARERGTAWEREDDPYSRII